ncbi:MAG: hypothetical protein ACREGH_04325 [Minisyncoccia bacterium]
MSDENPSKDDVKSVIDEKTNFLQTCHITPLEKKVNSIETNTSKEALQAMCSSVFSTKLREDEFRNKVRFIFNEQLKDETFQKKVENIAYKKIRDYVQNKMVWALVIWLLTIAASVLAERFLHLIP